MIIKRGIYIRGVVGSFKNLKTAKEAADYAASNDVDDYHDWEVHEIVKFKTDLNFKNLDDINDLGAIYNGVRTEKLSK